MNVTENVAVSCLIPSGMTQASIVLPLLFSILTTDTAADEKIDWRRLKSHLILLSLIKGRVLGLKQYQHWASKHNG